MEGMGREGEGRGKRNGKGEKGERRRSRI